MTLTLKTTATIAVLAVSACTLAQTTYRKNYRVTPSIFANLPTETINFDSTHDPSNQLDSGADGAGTAYNHPHKGKMGYGMVFNLSCSLYDLLPSGKAPNTDARRRADGSFVIGNFSPNPDGSKSQSAYVFDGRFTSATLIPSTKPGMPARYVLYGYTNFVGQPFTSHLTTAQCFQPHAVIVQGTVGSSANASVEIWTAPTAGSVFLRTSRFYSQDFSYMPGLIAYGDLIGSCEESPTEMLRDHLDQR